jgi:hypothetical protein
MMRLSISYRIFITVLVSLLFTISCSTGTNDGNNSYDRYPFTLENGGKTMVVNIFSRGHYNADGTNTPTPDYFNRTEKDTGQAFPFGTWINKVDSGEYLVFTEETFTRYSRFFDTYEYSYRIQDEVLAISLIKTIPNPNKIILPGN